MLTVTFYSFRGGVGRTMALANVAAHLSRKGLSVFLVDFDLEAPGLSLMPDFRFRPDTPPESEEGLVGYLRAGLEDRELPPLRSLCYEPVLAQKLRAQQPRAGAIHVLPADARAGGQRQYDLGRLHLDGLYETQGRSLVIDALKVQIEEEYHPDYVLVDSRTGLTDAGGICTVHLADLLVIVSGLNEQNLEGTRLAVERLRSARTDFADNVLFVISPVPVGEEGLKAERLADAAARFAAAMQTSRDLTEQLLTVPYHPQIALSEGSFVFHHPQSPVSEAFVRIAEAIRDHNPADLDRTFDQLIRQAERGNRQAMKELVALADSDSAPRRARMLAALIHLEAGEYERAIRLCDALLRQDPADFGAMNVLGLALSALAETRTGKEADGLFSKACNILAAALKGKPDMHEALSNWGSALLAQAKTRSAAEADPLFTQACEKFAAALLIKPDMHEALNNWGMALFEQGRKKSGVEADELFAQARQKLAAALQIKPDKYEAFSNWGIVVSAQATRKTGQEAEELFAEAYIKYAAALQIKPDMPEAFVNWANTLSAQAKTKAGTEADALLAQASAKYAAALQIKPDMPEALSYWGHALLVHAARKTGADAELLLSQAEEKLSAAEQLRPGTEAYNLACAAARRGQSEACRQWLERSRAAGTLPSHRHLSTDKDLEAVRNEPWFAELLASVS